MIQKADGALVPGIMADILDRNRESRTFRKHHGIRLSEPGLSRPREDETEEDKAQTYRDSVERSVVESRHGIAKRRYGLDRIMPCFVEAGLTEAVLQALVLNMAHLLRL